MASRTGIAVDGDADFDAHLDEILIGGQEHREIIIEQYDPDWPERYETERRTIETALGGQLLAIHHVGSTSVPGLATKPVIDIVIEVRQPRDEESYVPALEAVGYELRVRESDHHMLRTVAKDVHVHCWQNPDDIDRHLLFRDWLRRSPGDRDAYARCKTELATREWKDTNYYARAKSELLEEIMGRAEAWNAHGRPEG